MILWHLILCMIWPWCIKFCYLLISDLLFYLWNLGALVIMKRDVISILSELFLGGRPLSPPSTFCSHLCPVHVWLVTFFLHMISRWAYKVHVATRFIDYNQGCKLFFFYCNLCTWALFTVDWHAEKNSRAIETLIIMAWDYL